MFAQQLRARYGVCGPFGAVCGEKISCECQIMREARVRVEIKLQVLLRPVGLDVAEVLFEVSTLEDVHNLARELVKRLLTTAAQVEACKLVVERGAVESVYGTLVDLLLLRGEVVLLQELGESFVEQRVVGIAVQLSAQYRERCGKLTRCGEAAEVAIEYLGIGRGRGGGYGRCDRNIQRLLKKCGSGWFGGRVRCRTVLGGSIA